MKNNLKQLVKNNKQMCNNTKFFCLDVIISVSRQRMKEREEIKFLLESFSVFHIYWYL